MFCDTVVSILIHRHNVVVGLGDPVRKRFIVLVHYRLQLRNLDFVGGAFYTRGALCRVALCATWRFVPRGAFRWRFPGLPMWRFLDYVALSRQKAPHRAG